MKILTLTVVAILVSSIGIIPLISVEAAKDDILSKNRQEKAKIDKIKESKIKSKSYETPKDIKKLCTKKLDPQYPLYSEALKKIQKLLC